MFGRVGDLLISMPDNIANIFCASRLWCWMLLRSFSLPAITVCVSRKEPTRSRGGCATYDQPKFDGTNSKIHALGVCHVRMAQMGYIKAVGAMKFGSCGEAHYNPLVYRR